ncbi:hypothetical protein [Nocardioides terrisoli]|uniref:hypothetical protein n=1 Tax=Nocardioides terrisoli TaxID=3388267 RepID=UPI00287BB9D1|nr:hypothetical protein [Nocardioides marmorisolisilvae]
MNDDELSTRLHRAAAALPGTDLLEPSLRRAHRIHVRRLAGGAAAVVGLVAVIAFSGAVLAQRGQHTTGPVGPSPSPSQSAVRTVPLTHLATGPVPRLDYVDRGHTVHTRDGHTFPLGSDPSYQANVTVAAVGVVALLEAPDGQYRIAINGGTPSDIPVIGRADDYRFIRPGPHGTAFVEGSPGRLIVVGRDGTISTLATPRWVRGSTVTATRDFFWTVWKGRARRLDPVDPRAGWKSFGPAESLVGDQPADTVWDQRASCAIVHDGQTWRRLWSDCDQHEGSFTAPSGAGGDYTVVVHSRQVRVVGARDGRPVVTFVIPPGEKFGSGPAWSGDQLTFQLAHGRMERPVTWVTCDVSALRCWRNDLPLNLAWLDSDLPR